MGDKGTNETTQKSAPDPAAMKAYQDLMERASGVANTPYQSYGGNLTAGVNAQQNLGIGNINTASQAGNPWFQYAATMAHPLAQSDIQNYQNPYTQQVVDATQAQFDRSNAQQQEGLKGRAISQGSLGGSRANIAAADLGYQQNLGQAPVIAGLYNNSYQQALAAAQQQQQAGFQGAGVGANIQQAGIQGAGAQIGAGTLQQQTEQQQLNALYQQYQQAQAFPYQQTQWLAGIDTGVGSQMGGTSTTTAPAPSLLGQLAGVGTAAAGAYLGAKAAWRGGGVGSYDAGGSVGSDPYGGVGFVPRMQIHGGAGAPHPPSAAQIPQQKFDPSKFAFPKSGVGNYGGDFSEGLPGGAGFGGEAAPFGGAAPEAAEAAGSFLPEGLAGVGSSIMSALPEGLSAALPFLLLNRGGGVRGYDDGGPVEPYYPYGDQEAGDEAPPMAGVGASAPTDAWGGLGDTVSGLQNGPSPYFNPRASFPTSSARSPSGGGDDARPQGVGPAPMAPAFDDGAYDASRAPVAGVAPKAGFDWSSLSMPLMAAGLGMMASRSPHPGVAIGEGGLAGVQAYATQKRETAEQGLAEKKQALDARRLDQMAQQSREHLALQTRTQDFHEKQADRPYQEMTAHDRAMLARSDRPYNELTAAEKVAVDRQTRDFDFRKTQADRPYTEQTAQQKAELEARRTPPGWVRDPDGKMIPDPGGMHDPETIQREAMAKLPPSTLTPGALRMAGEQYYRTGTFPAQLGRGTQGPQDIRAAMAEGDRIALENGVKPEELPKRWQQFKSEQVGIQRFMSGKQGDTIRSLNVATDHVETARQLAEALKNGNFPLFNSLAQRFAEQTGSSVPTNFEAVGQIVGTEVLKAIGVAGAGGVEDRAKIQKVFSTSRSPEQLQGAINDVVRPLLVGQLRGLKRQFTSSTGLPGEKFDDLLEPATQSWLKVAGPGHAATPATSTASAPKRVKQNGHTYEQQPDGSYKPVD